MTGPREDGPREDGPREDGPREDGPRDFTPRPYQHLIVDHILRLPRCAVWSDMGTGKSVATLLALDALALSEDIYPALIIAPLIVARDTWPEEPRKWTSMQHLEVLPILGNPAARLAVLRRSADIYAVNYENVPWLVEHFGKRWPFRTVVVDEARKLKSFRLRQGGKRTAALASVAHRKVTRLIQLTGAPAPNGLLDLYGQAWFLDGGQRLGRTYTAFTQRWFQTSFNGFEITPLPFAQEQIQGALSDVCLRVDAADWFDLTTPIHVPRTVDLPPRARRIYREMERELFTRLADRTVEAANAAAKTQKLLQCCAGAMYVDPLVEGDEAPGSKEWREVHDVKLQALASIVAEAGGSPVLVAYHFRSDKARLLKAFPGARDLADPVQLREFKSGRYEVGLAHPASLGHGVDGLQAHCHRIAFFSQWWDMDQRDQIIGRIGPVRQCQAGHTRPVYVYDIIARNTVDELVLARHASKRSVQAVLLDAMKRR